MKGAPQILRNKALRRKYSATKDLKSNTQKQRTYATEALPVVPSFAVVYNFH
jgi:hypothetical protein